MFHAIACMLLCPVQLGTTRVKIEYRVHNFHLLKMAKENRTGLISYMYLVSYFFVLLLLFYLFQLLNKVVMSGSAGTHQTVDFLRNYRTLAIVQNITSHKYM